MWFEILEFYWNNVLASLEQNSRVSKLFEESRFFVFLSDTHNLCHTKWFSVLDHEFKEQSSKNFLARSWNELEKYFVDNEMVYEICNY